jgi:cytosine/adenosine deaminase-related metal-dependent hydrolase
MKGRLVLAGQVLVRGEFVEGWVSVEGGRVSGVGEGPPPGTPEATGVIVPGLVNAHTHAGDAAVPPPPDGMSPEQVFAPPGGYKHRMLERTPADALVAGTAAFLDRMTAAGVVRHSDFREGGVAGVEQLELARARAASPPASVVYGRPSGLLCDTRELDALLPRVHGLGLSAARDWQWERLVDVVAHARAAGRPVALHCSEVAREELSRVLDLRPEHLVHMVHGTSQDFRDIAAARVPVVACPRSVARFGLRSPVLEMRREGVEIRLGTDNAMLQSPDVLLEVAHLLKDPRVAREVPPLEVLGWAMGGAKGSNTVAAIGVVKGSSELALLPSDGSEPLVLLSRGVPLGARLVLGGGRIWRS